MKRADIVSVRTLFSGSARYRCGTSQPDFGQSGFGQSDFHQTGFRWGPPEIAQLLSDIETAARDSIDEEDVSEQRLYLGAITVSPGRSGISILHDGRQRLTMIALILAFARDRLPSSRERNMVDKVLVRRAFGRPPEARLRLTPEEHAWFAHFVLPPGATRRLPASAPLGAPRNLVTAASFLQYAFETYTPDDIRNVVDFLLHHTAVVRSVGQHRPVATPAPVMPKLQPPRVVWTNPQQPAAPPATRSKAAGE